MVPAMVRPGHGTRATSLILRWMLASLRVFVLLCAVQASGAVHIVEDIVGACVAEHRIVGRLSR